MLWDQLFARTPHDSKPVLVQPNRAARRALSRMKPGEQHARLEASALRRARRKAARGYRPEHVKKRRVAAVAFARGYHTGAQAALTDLQRRMKRGADEPGRRTPWMLPRWLSAILRQRRTRVATGG